MVVVETGARADVFDTVYAANYASLIRLAYVTIGSMPAAEDVVQDVFVEWYRRIDRVDAPAAYLRKSVVFRCSSWIRRRILERRHAGTFDQPPVVPPDPRTVAVRVALSRLTPRYRMALFLRYYLDLSVADVAETLDCPIGTAKSLLHRGLAHMQEHLEDR